MATVLESKGYRLLDESTSRVFIRRDVTFNETDFCHTTETQSVEPNDTLIVDSDLTKIDESESEHQLEEQMGEESETEHSQSKRPRRPPIKYGFDEYADLAGIENQVDDVAYNASQITEPKSMKEAMESEQARQWKQATDSEYKSLIENETWDLVELPSGRTRQLDVNGYSRSSIKVMVELNVSRAGLLLKGMLRSMV